MKIHICSQQTIHSHGKNFKTGHYLDLPNGKVISIGEIADVHEEALLTDGAIALPHMLSPEPLGEIADALAHLGVRAEHKTFEALMILKRQHPAFNPSAF
ncbi:MAG TPA: hypothetical protein VN939_04390 [Chthoniobacterales bacterium]|nr:hypothetical protein [Chthoniobacterales bacterium]